MHANSGCLKKSPENSRSKALKHTTRYRQRDHHPSASPFQPECPNRTFQATNEKITEELVGLGAGKETQTVGVSCPEQCGSKKMALPRYFPPHLAIGTCTDAGVVRDETALA